jgi:hypothetical protein
VIPPPASAYAAAMLPRPRFASILLALSTASLGIGACSSGAKGTGSGATTGGTGATGGAGGGAGACPTDTPSNGAACAGVQGGTACQYAMPCCNDTIATCNGGHWDVEIGECAGVLPKPPPPSCPPQQPAEGSACSADCLGPTTCEYGTCPGSMQPAVLATCTGTWVISVQCDGGAGNGGGGGAGGGG